MYIGIDIGGTNTKIIVSNSLNNINQIGKINFETAKFFEEGTNNIFEYIDSLQIKIQAIGISIAGTINENKTQLIKSNNLFNRTNKKIIKKFQEKYNCKIFLENDAISQGLAEYYFGDKKEKFLYIVWGTGIGGILFSEGKIESLSRKYLKEAEKNIGGNRLISKYGHQIQNLSKNDWNNIILEFKKLLEKLKENIESQDIIIAGGIIEKQKKLINNLICNESIYISKLNKNIGTYGGLAIIKKYIK